MKKILSILLIMVLLLTGCSSKEETAADVLIKTAENMSTDSDAYHIDIDIDSTIDDVLMSTSVSTSAIGLSGNSNDLKTYTKMTTDGKDIEAYTIDGTMYMIFGPLKMSVEDTSDLSGIDASLFSELMDFVSEDDQKTINQTFVLEKGKDNDFIIKASLNSTELSEIKDLLASFSESAIDTVESFEMNYYIDANYNLTGFSIMAAYSAVTGEKVKMDILASFTLDASKITIDTIDTTEFKSQEELTEEDYIIFLSYLMGEN